MIYDPEKFDYLAGAVHQWSAKIPYIHIDHDGFYEVVGIVLDALEQYNTGQNYIQPDDLWAESRPAHHPFYLSSYPEERP